MSENNDMVSQTDTSIEEVEKITKNTLLDAITLPGEKFRLPSKGKLYDEGVLDHSVSDGEIEVKSMSAIDDIMMKTPDLLLDGTAILKVIKNTVPQILKPEELLSIDADYLLACIRKVSFGSTYEIKWKCINEEFHKKNKSKPKNIRYPMDVGRLVRNNVTEIDDEMFEEHFVFTLSNNQVIHIKPLLFTNSIEILKKQYEFENSPSDDAENDVKELLDIIILPLISRVDDITNKEQIREWLHKLPKKFIDAFRDHLDKIPQFGIDFTYHITCEECGEKEEVTASVNPVGFFTAP